VTIEIPPSDDQFDSLEEHDYGEHIIRIEFYKTSEDLFFVWPYVRVIGGDSDKMRHFQVRGHFPDKAQAREAALLRGRTLISSGFDVNSAD